MEVPDLGKRWSATPRQRADSGPSWDAHVRQFRHGRLHEALDVAGSDNFRGQSSRPYELLSPPGGGGMGKVYWAGDQTRLRGGNPDAAGVRRRSGRGSRPVATGARGPVKLRLILVAGFGLRLLAILVAPASVDVANYEIVAATRRAGGALYSTGVYNYSPVWAWGIYGTDALSRAIHLPFGLTVRMELGAADIACAIAVGCLAARRGLRPQRAAALVSLNPVLIWISCIQGQFDSVALLLLLAAFAMERRVAPPRGRRWASLCMAASVAVKQVTLPHVLLWWRTPGGRRVAGVTLGVLALLFGAYWEQWRNILAHVVLYRSVPRSYGFSEFVLWDARFAWPLLLLAGLSSGIVAITFGAIDRERAALAVALALLVFAPGIGAQYLAWPLVLGSLWGGRRYLLVTGAGLLWILGSHYGWRGSGPAHGPAAVVMYRSLDGRRADGTAPAAPCSRTSDGVRLITSPMGFVAACVHASAQR